MSILHQPYIIGIAGGTASGKTTMAKTIIGKIGPNRVAYINYDCYYKDLGHLTLDERFKTNFDHPESLDTDLLIEHLKKIRDGQSIEVPTYDFKTCMRLNKTIHVDPLDVVIVDGILALADERLREIYDLKIFVELNADERILRRLERDVKDRGRTIESVVNQYRDTVRPMHDLFVEPSRQYADIVVPGEASKSAALEAVAGQVLGKVELARRRSSLEILQRISSTTSQKTSQDLLSTIVQIAAQELSADNVTLHQYDSLKAMFLTPSEFSATWPLGGELQKPREDGLSAYVIKHGSIIVTDIALESNSELIQTVHLMETNTKAFLGIRLEASGEFLGVLFLNYLKPRQIDLDEQNLANILGMYAAIAIHRNRLYNQMQSRFTKLRGLSEIGSRLLIADYGTLKDEITKIAAEEMSADNVTLHQYDEILGEFLDPLIFSSAWPSVGKLTKPRLDGVSAYVVKKGTVFVTNINTEINQELVQTAHLAETNTKAFLGIQLVVAGEILGVLFFNYQTPKVFEPDEQLLANIIATYVSIAIYNARLLKKLQLSTDNLKALSEIGSRLLTVDYQTIKSEIVNFVAKELTPENVTLHQYDASRGEFLDPVLYSATWPAGGLLQKPRKDGVSAYVLEHGSISITNIAAEKNQDLIKTAHLTQTGTKAFMGIRLEAGNEILGVLFLNYSSPREFKPQEESLANVLGMYAATAIHRARLYEQIQLGTKRIQDLSEVAGNLLSADYEYVKEEIVRFTAKELEADNVTLHQYDATLGDFLEPVIFSATWPSGGELQKPRKEGVSAYVVDHGTVLISSVETEPNRELVQTAYLIETGTKAFIGIRLEAGGDVLGVLFINYLNSQNFGVDRQALVQVLAVYASAAILSARSYRRRLAERQAENLLIVNEIANAIEVHVELDNFLQSLLELSLSRLSAPRGSIQLLREENLELHAAVGLERGRSETLISLHQGITGLAIREKRFIYEPDTSKNASFLPYLGETRSEMAAPLSVGNIVLGVLNAEHPQPDAFDDEKQELFQLIASQAAIIIHQKLKLDEEISKRQLAEQKALLTDIAFDTQHHIGNKVSMVRIRAMELLEDASLNLSTSQRRKLNIILNNAEVALKASKHVLETRKPPTPEWITPSALIEEMLDLVDTVPEVELRIEVSSDLPKVYVDKDRTEYAIKDLVTNAQRAILNSSKNKGYVAITSRITQDKHYVELRFTNDGPPIPRTEWENIFKKGPGFGLPTAKALLRSQSGDIELIESDPNKTTFVVRLLSISPSKL